MNSIAMAESRSPSNRVMMLMPVLPRSLLMGWANRSEIQTEIATSKMSEVSTILSNQLADC